MYDDDYDYDDLFDSEYPMEMMNFLFSDIDCCAVNLIKNLGEQSYDGSRLSEPASIQNFMRCIKESHGDFTSSVGSNYDLDHVSVLMAISNDESQPTVVKYLKEIGFDRAGPYNHISIWTIHPKKFKERYRDLVGESF